MEKIKVLKHGYHRNGVCGTGFAVATFKWRDGNEHHHMVGIVFPNSGECAVLDIDELVKDNVEFARGNSWRGDHFEDALRQAMEFNKEDL